MSERFLVPSLRSARASLALAAIGAALSCTGSAPESGPEAEPLTSVADLAARYPAVAPWLAEAALAPARPSEEVLGGGFWLTSAPSERAREVAAPSAAGAWASLSRAVTMQIPGDGGGVVRVGVEGTGLSVAVRRVGAATNDTNTNTNNAGKQTQTQKPSLEGGAVVVRGASLGVDALYFARERGIEELLRVSKRGAELAYQIDLPQGYRLRKSKTARGLLEVLDDAGVAWLRLRADKGWDAAGREIEIDMELEGGRVGLEIASEARYPVLVDPLWESTTSPATPRDDHSATLLPTGKVLLTGGWGLIGKATLSAELYDPATGTFTETASTEREHAQHSATLLREGRVLIAGGNHINAGAEIYDPRVDQFVEELNLPEPRFGHTATMLTDGDVLLAGGYLIGIVTTPLSTAELFRADTGSFEATKGPLPAPRGGHSAMLLPDRRVLLCAGEDKPKMQTSTADIYDPNTGTFSPAGVTSVYGTNAATLLPTEEGLIVGEASAELFSNGVFTPVVGPPFLFDVTAGALLPNGQVLVAEHGGAPHLYDADTKQFSPLPDAPCAWETTTLLGSGTVLVTGEQACVYDPTSGAIDSPKATATKRVDFASVLLPTGKVLIAGGRESPDAPFAELFDPVTGAFSTIQTFEHSFNFGFEFTRAVLLADGTVLVHWGPDPDQKGLSQSDGGYFVFDASTGKATPKPWNGAVTTLVGDGTVLGVEADEVNIYSLVTEKSIGVKKPLAKGTGHAALRLPDGTVLIAGGAGELGDGRMELYHPKSGKIEVLDAEVKGDLRGLVLPSGKVLFAGAGHLAMYNPKPSGIVPLPLKTIPVFKERPLLALLPSGKVLLAGPTSEDLSETRAVVYDPVTEHATEPMIVPVPKLRTATLLPSGDVLLMGEETWSRFRDTSVPDALAFTRPILKEPPSKGAAGGSTLTLSGSGFTGISEAGSGRTDASPTNYPLALWVPIPVGTPQWGFLSNWTDTSVEWSIPTTTYPGLGLLYIVTNGVRSQGRPFIIEPAEAGTPCAAGPACASLACVTGVCCQEACEDGCYGCSKAVTGHPDGSCAPILAETDPRGACSDDAQSICSPFSQSSPCEETTVVLSCSEGNACDGAGKCAPVPDGTPCVLGLHCKEGECTDRCTSNNDCGPKMVCSVEGRCSPPIDEGPGFSSCASAGVGPRRTFSNGAGTAGLIAVLLAFAARDNNKRRRGAYLIKFAERASTRREPMTRERALHRRGG